MMRDGSSLGYGLVLFVVASLLAGCAGLPAQEMSDARQAISAAQAAGGAYYTPETLERARQLVDQALHEAEQGDYRAARIAAQSAKQQATFAREASLSVQAGD